MAEVGLAQVIVHDAHADDPQLAFALVPAHRFRWAQPGPGGDLFRDVQAPSYDDLARAQLQPTPNQPKRLADLQRLITGEETWTA